jgi:Mn-dependent DtxR family transcriptional regulator
MTDLIQALSTALARLATLEEIVARLDKLETLQHELGDGIALTDRMVNRIEDRVRMLEDGANEDLDDRVGEILDRKLDHVLESALEDALSGREITITL